MRLKSESKTGFIKKEDDYNLLNKLTEELTKVLATNPRKTNELREIEYAVAKLSKVLDMPYSTTFEEYSHLGIYQLDKMCELLLTGRHSVNDAYNASKSMKD